MNLSRSQVNPTPEAYNTCYYFKSSASDLCNNNRNYDSNFRTSILLDQFFEDEFGKAYLFSFIIVIALHSSMDSDLEAFSHNPTDGSFTALAGQLTVFTNYLDQRFLSYLISLLSQCFHQQGKTNLSRDGLNPAHVPY